MEEILNTESSTGENSGGDVEVVAPAKVEKLNLKDITNAKSEMNFSEEMERIKNDPMLYRDAYNYLKTHKEEFKEIFGCEIKFDE